ncbi:MAG TPA: ABC transporter permease [Acidimicrobiales bacterium]|nr:ABC transporter permease [Acidimicrobiales bacterium]
MNRRYVVRRLLQVLPAVASILIVTFAVVHAAPGDPVVAVAGESGNEEYYAFMRDKFGLDEPLVNQFWTYSTNVLQGDLGTSFVQGQSVVDLILERMPATLLLMGSALVVSSVGGVVLGALAARRPFGPFDLGVSTGALIGYALPSFWLAQLAMLTIAFRTGWFPIQGMTDARADYSGIAHYLDVARHLVLPSLVLAASEVALITRIARTGILAEMDSDYVRVAQAKGLSPTRALVRHALRNALLPVVTVIGTRIGFLFSGAVLVETVFGWPGLGRLVLSAAQTRDHPLLLGMVLLVAFSLVLANLVTDLVYARVDPRIRYR